MFNTLSNGLCNSGPFSLAESFFMSQKKRHASLERLLDAANLLGPSALASALSESEQTVTNWGTRGVSKSGAIKAQNKFGCDANWILKGVGSRPAISEAPALVEILEALSSHLLTMSANTRHRAGYLLADLADSPEGYADIAAMLEAAAAPKATIPATDTDEDARRLRAWARGRKAEYMENNKSKKQKRN